MHISLLLGANMFEEMIHQDMDLVFVSSFTPTLLQNIRLTSTHSSISQCNKQT